MQLPIYNHQFIRYFRGAKIRGMIYIFRFKIVCPEQILLFFNSFTFYRWLIAKTDVWFSKPGIHLQLNVWNFVIPLCLHAFKARNLIFWMPGMKKTKTNQIEGIDWGNLNGFEQGTARETQQAKQKCPDLMWLILPLTFEKKIHR